MGWHFRQAAEMEGKPKEVPSAVLLRWLVGQLSPMRLSVAVLVASAVTSIVLGTISPYLGKVLIDRGILAGDVGTIAFYSALIAVLALARWFSDFLRGYLTGKVNQRLLYGLRGRTFKHIEEMDVAYMSGERTGKMISLIASDISAIGDVATSGAIEALVGALSIVGAVYAMLSLNVQLSLATFSVLPAIVLVSVYLARKTRRAYRLTREKISELTSNVEQGVSGSRVSQSFASRRDVDSHEFDRVSRDTMKANLKARIAFAMVRPSLDAIRAIYSVLLIVYGGSLVASGELSLGTLIAFYSYTDMFFRPVITLTTFYNMLQSALAAAERVYLFLRTEPRVKELEGARDMEIVKGEVELRDVHFGYGENRVFEGLDLRVNAGEILAIVGPTGAGKTTLANLVMRLYDADSGQVLIDGHDVREFTFRSLRRQVALVPQEPILFNDSVLENIRIGRTEASEEEVKKVVEALGLEGMISGLPEGYRTVISPGGGNLSVGQRQLISFVRAMLKNPKVLILDEATSSLDPYTESMLQEAMVKLMRGRTCLLIAHRLSTVRLADRIIVLEGGRIVEEGSHEELLSKGGAYAKLYEIQFGAIPVVAKSDPDDNSSRDTGGNGPRL
jgi:ATP-binding cassette subfamily B protein